MIESPIKYQNEDDRRLAVRLLTVYRAVCQMKEHIFHGDFELTPENKNRLRFAHGILERAYDQNLTPTFNGCVYGPESIGVDRAYGAVGDAKACLYDAINGNYYQNSIVQASCELWAAIMNLHNGLGLIDDESDSQNLLDYLDTLRCGL